MALLHHSIMALWEHGIIGPMALQQFDITAAWPGIIGPMTLWHYDITVSWHYGNLCY